MLALLVELEAEPVAVVGDLARLRVQRLERDAGQARLPERVELAGRADGHLVHEDLAQRVVGQLRADAHHDAAAVEHLGLSMRTFQMLVACFITGSARDFGST